MPNEVFQDPDLQLLRINDFSAGIHQRGQSSQAATQTLSPVQTLPAFTTPFAPLGSCQSAFRCINEPGVGLVPLPNYNTRFGHVNPSLTPRANPVLPLVVCGMGLLGNVGPIGQEDSLYVTLGYETSAIQRSYDHIRLQTPISSPTGTFLLNEAPPANVIGVYFGRTWVKTRIQQTPPGGGLIAQPTMVVNNPETTTALIYTPSTTNNTMDTTVVNMPGLPGGTQLAPAAIIAHEFRIVILTQAALGSSTYQMGTDGQFIMNEDVLFTDPPESTGFVSFTGTVIPHFDPEDISGWGAWGSINSGELCLIRMGGGAVLLDGDMSQPNVTKLPGVVGTGHIFGQGAMTGGGLYYLSEFDGAYVWNGSNTSQKISQQIPDDALMRTHSIVQNLVPGALPSPALNLVNTHHCAWGSWVIFAHNWLYDTITQSWWRLQDPGVDDFEVFKQSESYRRYLYAMPGFVNNPTITTGPKFVAFDRLTRQPTWTWTSNPIAPIVGSLVDIRVIEIMASNPTGNAATISVTASSVAGAESDTVSFTIPANTTAVRLAQRVGYKNYTVVLTVTAANNNLLIAAPILHEISLGYLADTSPTALT